MWTTIVGTIIYVLFIVGLAAVIFINLRPRGD